MTVLGRGVIRSIHNVLRLVHGFRRSCSSLHLSEAAYAEGTDRYTPERRCSAELRPPAAVAGTPRLMHLDWWEGALSAGC